MIDIHNHILMDIDDGPQSNNAMIDLLNQAKSEGINNIVVTPHHLHPKYNNNIQLVKEEIKALKQNEDVQKLNINFLCWARN